MEEQEQQEEQQEEEKQEWEIPRLRSSIHSPRHLQHSPLQTHHRSLSDSHTQLKSCSTRETHFKNDDNRSIIFPPINHEGLHSDSSTTNHSQEVRKPSPRSSGEENGLLWVRASGTGWLGVGFELVRSRVARIGSWLRNFAGLNWSFGWAAAALVWWLFAVVRRRRRDRRVRRRESRDQLIRVIKERDEKINQLLHQIAQLNQLLLALHRDPLPGTGGVTK